MKLNKETKQLESIETYDIEDMVKLCNMILNDAEKEDKEFIKMSICDFKEIMKAWYYLLEECNKNGELIDKKEPHKGYKPTCFGNYSEECWDAGCGCRNKCREQKEQEVVDIEGRWKKSHEALNEMKKRGVDVLRPNCFGQLWKDNTLCFSCMHKIDCEKIWMEQREQNIRNEQKHEQKNN